MVRRPFSIAVAALAIQAAVVRPAAACPVCDTDTGRAVRAGILGEDFGRTLVAVLLPFPILFGVVAVIHLGGPRIPGAKHGGAANDPPDPRGPS